MTYKIFIIRAVFIFFFLPLLLESGFGGEPDSKLKKLHQLSLPEIHNLIREVSQTEPTMAGKMCRYSRLALGTPYALYCLGEGEGGKYDRDPLIDFSRVDCMTFCEQILALSISNTYQETFNNLQLIRYHRGKISYKTRNHFAVSNWLPNNRWLLDDVTCEIGAPWCRKMTKTIDLSLPVHSLPAIDRNDFPPPARQTVTYLPKEYLSKITAGIKGEEIVIIITNKPGIFASHMGLLVSEKDGALFFRHAGSQAKKVVDEPYENFCKRLLQNGKIAGVKLIRIKKDIDYPKN